MQHVSSTVASHAHLVVTIAATLLDRIRILAAVSREMLWWMRICVWLGCRCTWTTVFHAINNMSLHGYIC